MGRASANLLTGLSRDGHHRRLGFSVCGLPATSYLGRKSTYSKCPAEAVS